MGKGVKSMSKGAICEALATAIESKKSEMGKILDALAELATKETKSTGKFTIPGVCMVKKRHKPATKAGKRMAFGELVKVKAKPARNVVKAFALAALKKSVSDGTYYPVSLQALCSALLRALCFVLVAVGKLQG